MHLHPSFSTTPPYYHRLCLNLRQFSRSLTSVKTAEAFLRSSSSFLLVERETKQTMTTSKKRRTLISALSWIPKGASKVDPLSNNDEENEEEDEHVDVRDAPPTSTVENNQVFDRITQALEALHMEHYDDGLELFSSGTGDLYYPSNDMDPYLKDKNDYDSEELEDMKIHPTDSVIACACSRKKGLDDVHSDDDDDSVNEKKGSGVGFIEIWILEDRERNMYFHHGIELSAPPLCTAWLDCPLQGGERGNFLAVGSKEPSIEIWNLDILEVAEPCVVLGGTHEEKREGKMESIKYKNDGHTDSVLGLAWNKEYRNILASASADKQVKIWDVVSGKCDITMEHHSDKVQAVAWNHHAPQVLLSGSYDQTVVVRDVRMPSHSGYKWSLTADVESLAWDPHTEHSFVVSLDNGMVKCFDVRIVKSNSTSELSSTFTLHAHDEAVHSVSYNLSAPNLLATGSKDKTVKLWDLSNNQPCCVASHLPKIGAIYSVSFSEDNPFLLAIGGSKKKLRVWDALSDCGISQRYGNYNK